MPTKTGLVLALMATAALGGSAYAQSSSSTAAQTPEAGSTTPSPSTGSATSGSTAAGSTTSSNTVSGSSGTGSSSSNATAPGNQTANPNVYGQSSGQQQQGDWGGAATGQGGGNWGQWSGQGMMMPGGFSVMNCMSPAPMGGPGSFACYPAAPMNMGWNMGGNMGWHHPRFDNDHSPGRRWHSRERGETTPNGYYEDRQDYRRKSQDSYRSDGYDDDSQSYDSRNSRSDTRGRYDDRDDEDYSN